MAPFFCAISSNRRAKARRNRVGALRGAEAPLFHGGVGDRGSACETAAHGDRNVVGETVASTVTGECTFLGCSRQFHLTSVSFAPVIHIR
jgi:hypothetical protein